MLEISKLKKDLSKILYNNKPIKVLFKNHLSSTNDFFKYKYIKDQCPIVITTNNQRASRGRNNKIWFSYNQKSLSFSICLKLSADHMKLCQLNYLSCLSVLRAFKSTTNHTFKIKWPNDIYLDNRKVSGILIESESYGKDIFLSIPALAGASLLGLKDILKDPFEFNSIIFLTISISFIFSYLTIKFLLYYLNKFSLKIFVFYRIILAFFLFTVIYF